MKELFFKLRFRLFMKHSVTKGCANESSKSKQDELHPKDTKGRFKQKYAGISALTALQSHRGFNNYMRKVRNLATKHSKTADLEVTCAMIPVHISLTPQNITGARNGKHVIKANGLQPCRLPPTENAVGISQDPEYSDVESGNFVSFDSGTDEINPERARVGEILNGSYKTRNPAQASVDTALHVNAALANHQATLPSLPICHQQSYQAATPLISALPLALDACISQVASSITSTLFKLSQTHQLAANALICNLGYACI